MKPKCKSRNREKFKLFAVRRKSFTLKMCSAKALKCRIVCEIAKVYLALDA